MATHDLKALTLEGFERMFLEGLVEKYPELVGLRDELRASLAKGDHRGVRG